MRERRPRPNSLLPRDLETVCREQKNSPHPLPITDVGQADGPPLWSAPIPLQDTAPVPPFPLDVLPEPLRRFAQEATALVPCPPDYVAVPMLALAGAAIGSSRALEIKPGRAERPSLYAAVVGSPGCGKTPSLDTAAKPLYEEQSRLYEIFRREFRAHDEGVDNMPSPTERILYVSDVTVEKLASVLQENPRGVALVRDELAGWVRSMDMYRNGKGADRQHWLSVWSGKAIGVHRKAQENGPVRVAHPFISVVGGLQPDLLDTMRGDRALADGFIDRILFSYPDPHPAKGETWGGISEECEARWGHCLAALWALPMEDDPERGPRPRFVRLTPCGRQSWQKFTDALAVERNDESAPTCIRDALAKMNSYGARLALIVQFLRLVSGEVDGEDVDGESVDRAARLVDYFKAHARRVYAVMDADPRAAGARKLLHWIDREKRQEFTRRDAYRAMRGTCKSVEAVDTLLSLLERHGYIRTLPGEKATGVGRKRSPAFEVNPLHLGHKGRNGHNHADSPP